MKSRGMRSAEGQKLYKAVVFTVFTPGNKSSRRYKVTAPAGKGFHAEGIEEQVGTAIDKVERWFPGHEYRLVPTGPTDFSFIWVCEKPADPAAASKETEPSGN